MIAREHQKLLGISISVIGLLLVDFSFSKKPAGFLSKPDVFSRVLPDRSLQLAHFPILSCAQRILYRMSRHIPVPQPFKEAQANRCISLTGPLVDFF